jgi:hypothetical protein
MPRGRVKASPLVVGSLSPVAKGSVSVDLLHKAVVDPHAINQTLEEYVQAWFQGDSDGMERCLHPDLTARLVQLDGMSSGIQMLLRGQGIQASLGVCTHPTDRSREITILDVSGHSASARVLLGDWVAYVHLSFTGERWAIVNVMWEWLSSGTKRSA